MSYLMYILGVIIILLTIMDIIWTILWVDGGSGWLTNRLTTSIWKLLLKTENKLLMNLSGPLILSATLFSWVFFLWLGVTIFFAGDLNAIVNTSTNETISWYQLSYYSGFTLFTLGIGDFTPQTPLFQIFTALASGIGMLMLTFGASYIISVISAVVEKRTFARSVMGLGEDSVAFLINGWNGKNFSQLDLVLSDFSSSISQLTQQTQAFPLLQYYHSEEEKKAMAVAIAVLDEALSVLRYGITDDEIVNTSLVKMTQSSIQTFIDTSIDGYGNLLRDFEDIPSIINLSAFSHTDMPLNNQKNYAKKMEELREHRNRLLKVIKIDHRNWPN